MSKKVGVGRFVYTIYFVFTLNFIICAVAVTASILSFILVSLA